MNDLIQNTSNEIDKQKLLDKIKGFDDRKLSFAEKYLVSIREAEDKLKR